MRSTILISILIVISVALVFYIWDKPLLKQKQVNIQQTSTTTPSGAEFTDPTGTYRFYYPKNFILNEDVGYDQSWRTEATSSGSLLASVVIRKSFDPGTNFSDAAFTLGTSTDHDAVANCTKPSGGAESASGASGISDLAFTKFTSSGAGAGNFYETTSYRAVHNGECLSLEYTIHSTNIGNYPAEAGIKEFNKSKVQAALEEIVRSLVILK